MTHRRMTHSFGFKRIPGLPSGTVLSCFYLSRIRYFGTSTGNLIIRNENQKFSLKESVLPNQGSTNMDGRIRQVYGPDFGPDFFFVLVRYSDFRSGFLVRISD